MLGVHQGLRQTSEHPARSLHFGLYDWLEVLVEELQETNLLDLFARFHWCEISKLNNNACTHWQRFYKHKTRATRIAAFHDKIAQTEFFLSKVLPKYLTSTLAASSPGNGLGPR